MVQTSRNDSPPPAGALRRSIATLNPNDFALVMATGIISTACELLRVPVIGRVMFWLNLAAFAILAVLTALRLVWFPRRCFQDLIDHNRGVGYFTTVAATCVVGSQCHVIAEALTLAIVFWCIGIGLWFVLTYAIFTSFAVKSAKPSLPEGIHGGWLVSVVAAQSVAMLGALVAKELPIYQQQILFFSLIMWLGGGMLYIWIISLIFYRYNFFPMSPADLSPPYWINMGAMAISTLAGTNLAAAADSSPLLGQMGPFLLGLTLLFWSTATWWIPMLVILGAWRHIYRRFPLSYDPQYWGAVFPLGMYTVCTFRLVDTLDLPFLIAIPHYFVYIALAAWLLAFAGMVFSLTSQPK